tara:strand:- start:477 stop:797 length:321 start_codon:yes stop_codon:yes gene_type:complete
MSTRLDKAKSNVPDIRDLLAEVHTQLGGTEECARLMADDVKASSVGSSQRITFWNAYLGTISKFGGDDDLDKLDEEDLQAQGRQLMAAEAALETDADDDEAENTGA